MSHDFHYVVRGCHVSNSSGCHRYSYWNEQFLFDGRNDTGWCTPSRSKQITEFLEISLPRKQRISGLRLLSRSINRNAGFSVEFSVHAMVAGDWKNALNARDVIGYEDCWYRWHFETPPTDAIRLEING